MTKTALGNLLERIQNTHLQRFKRPACIDFDPDWRSPCEIGDPSADKRIRWQHIARTNASLNSLEQALQLTLHPCISAYYCSYWFPGLTATHAEGELELLGVWNGDDFDNLQANIIGHVLQQRRARAPASVFFALPLAEDEYCLSIDNDSGSVVLERIGANKQRHIANSLAEFLDQLTPHFPHD